MKRFDKKFEAHRAHPHTLPGGHLPKRQGGKKVTTPTLVLSLHLIHAPVHNGTSTRYLGVMEPYRCNLEAVSFSYLHLHHWPRDGSSLIPIKARLMWSGLTRISTQIACSKICLSSFYPQRSAQREMVKVPFGSSSSQTVRLSST